MKIEFYSKTGCPFCSMAKEYLAQRGIAYDEILYEDYNERQSLYDRFELKGDQRSVPQIFLVEEDGKRLRIGGYTDLIKSDVTARHYVGDFNMEF